MRIQLSRNRNNEFTIPTSFLYKDRIRIVEVYENETLLTDKEYQFIGPRKIKMLRVVPEASKVYGRIADTNTGNKMAGR